jgi:hypothetical protein
LEIATFVTRVTAEAWSAAYTQSAMQGMEAPMTTNLNSRVAIQARIAEWQRQHHTSDDGSNHFVVWNAKAHEERVRWLQRA